MKWSSEFVEQELSVADFPTTWQILQTGVSEGVAPGFVVGLWQQKNADSIQVAAIGNRRQIPSPLPMTKETIFDLASVTKIFGTATLAAYLVDRGWIRWNTPLKSFFPNYPSREIEIRHLLSHTAGLVAWEPFWEKIRLYCGSHSIESVPVSERQKWMRHLVFKVKPEFAPGEKTLYSDLSFLLLGFALEESVQMPLDGAIQRLLWNPMGIQSAFYRRVTQSVQRSIREEVAATESCSWRGGVLQGQVHDDNCWAMGGYAGHAGAFGTVRDVLHFVRRLWEGFLTRETLNAMWTRVDQPLHCERTLGWDTPSGETPSASRSFSPHSVGHLGFTGTSLWVDLEAKLAVTLLSNRVHPSRENTKIKEFRPRFHEAIRQDLARLL